MNISTYKTKLRLLSPGDIANISILIILSIIELILANSVTIWYYLIPLNISIIIIIFFSTTYYEASKTLNQIDEHKFSFLKLFRYWYAVPLILTCFKEVYIIINYIKPHNIDDILIALDWKIFGVNPTQWAYRFASPSLTEFLQIIYFFYYIMIIVYGLELYLWKRYSEYKYAMYMIVLGFWISYLLYLILPAVGPRFTLHNFHSISTELPGLFLTEKIRAFLDFGESIPAGVGNPIDFAQRDAFPSLHLSAAILVAYLSRKIKSKSFYFYLPYCILIAISTIYLRYHYVVDLFAGIITVVFVIILGNYLFKYKKS